MMMIRSQDKKWLTPFDKPIYVRSDDDAKEYCIAMDNGDPKGYGDLTLDKYAPESRCIEILDEIEERYRDYSECGQLEVDIPKVYWMPKE